MKPRTLRTVLAARLLVTNPHAVRRFLALTKKPLWRWESWAITARSLQLEARTPGTGRTLSVRRRNNAESTMMVLIGKMAVLDIRSVLRSTARRLSNS